MTHQDLLHHFGNGAKAARALGYTRQAISRWKSSGIPFEAQFEIQIKTKGRLKADMPQRLREKRVA